MRMRNFVAIITFQTVQAAAFTQPSLEQRLLSACFCRSPRHNDAFEERRGAHEQRDRHPSTGSATAKGPPVRIGRPRIWEGCNLFAWLNLLWRGRFAIHPKFWHIAVIVTFVSTFHSLVRLLQQIFYGRAIANGDCRSADFHHWPLAHGHDLASRAARLGRTPCLSDYLRVLRPQSLSPHRRFFQTVAELLVAFASTHGQHGSGLGPSARRRIRPLHVGPTVALLDHCLSQSASEMP